MGSSTTAKKRKLPSTWDGDESGGVSAETSKSQTSPKKKAKSKAPEEKRLRRFVSLSLSLSLISALEPVNRGWDEC